jgi:hypothetical protein
MKKQQDVRCRYRFVRSEIDFGGLECRYQRNQRNAIIDTWSIDCNAIFKRDMQALSNVDAWRS